MDSSRREASQLENEHASEAVEVGEDRQRRSEERTGEGYIPGQSRGYRYRYCEQAGITRAEYLREYKRRYRAEATPLELEAMLEKDRLRKRRARLAAAARSKPRPQPGMNDSQLQKKTVPPKQ